MGVRPFVAAAVAWAALGGSPIQAQEASSAGVVTRARLEADLTVDPGDVAVTYTLRSVPESRILGLQVLPLEGVDLSEVAVEVGGVNRGVVRFTASASGLLQGGVALGPRGADEIDLELTLRYELPPALEGAATVIPVVVAGTATEGASPDFFTADVAFPAATRVTGAFPSVYELDTDSTGATFRTSLKVLPAFLRIQTHGRSILRPTRVAEALVLALLAALAYWGWGAFKREAFGE